jgi:hypothetical protein
VRRARVVHRRAAPAVERFEPRTLLIVSPATLATVAGAAPQVAVDAAGDVFGTTSGSGTTGGTVFEIRTGTTTVTTLATFAPATDGTDPKDIVIDAAGNLFGDSGPSAIGTDGSVDALWELPAGTSTLKVLGTFGGSGIDGVPAYPASSLSIDAFDDLFFSEVYHDVEGDFPSIGEYVASQGAIGPAADAVDNLNFTQTQLLDLYANDPAGNAYVLYTFMNGDDGEGANLYRVPAGTAQVSIETGDPLPGDEPSLAIFNGTPGSGDFPADMVTDPAGDLFVTTADGKIDELKASASILTTVATVSGASFGTFGSLATDGAGDLFAVTGGGTLVELPAGATAVRTVATFEGGSIGGLTANVHGDVFGTSTSGGSASVFALSGIGAPGSPTPTPTPPVTVLPTTTITGTVFDDANGDGALDDGEQGLADQTVYLDVNGDGKLDAGDVSATTDAAGHYTLSAVHFGTYALREVVPAGDTQTLPTAGSYSVSVAGTQTVAGDDFGEVPTATLKHAPPATGVRLLGSLGSDGRADTDVGLDAAGDVFAVADPGTDDNSAAGAVFEVAARTTTAAQVASFGPDAYVDDPAGRGPYGHIVVDAAGDVFGLTEGGAAPGNLWERFAGSSTVVNLDGFTGYASQPDSLTVDAAGDLFGTAIDTAIDPDYDVNRTGSGTVLFEYPADGSGERLLTLPGTAMGPVVSDAAGDLFGLNGTGLDPETAAPSGYAVYEVSAAAIAAATAAAPATVTKLTAFTVAADGSAAGLTVDDAGDVYVTTTTALLEVPAGSGKVHRLASVSGDLTLSSDPSVDAAGDVFAVGLNDVDDTGSVVELVAGSAAIVQLASLPADNLGGPAADLAHDAAGNLYGVTTDVGSNQSEVFEVTGRPFADAPPTPTPVLDPTPTPSNLTLLGSVPGPLDSGIGLDGAGDIFGTTASTAPGDDGVLFEVRAGTTTATDVDPVSPGITADDPDPDGRGPVGRVVVNAAGDVFGLTAGPIDDGTLWEQRVGSPTVTVLATLDQGVLDPASLTTDAAGDLFGTYIDTTYDPYQTYATTGHDTVVFEYPADGSGLRVLTAPGNATGPIVSDGAGDLFGLDAIATDNGTTTPSAVTGYEAYEVSAAAIAAATPDAPAPAAGLGSFDVADEGTPVGLSVDDAGDVYITTAGDVFVTDAAAIANGDATTGNGGGAAGYGAILEVPADSGQVVRLASVGKGITLTSDPLVDANGNVFAVGRTAGDTTAVYELVEGSTTATQLAALPATAVPYNLSPALTHDAAGNLYGVITQYRSGEPDTTQAFEVTGRPYAVAQTVPHAPTPTPTPTVGLMPAVVRSTLPTSVVSTAASRGVIGVRLTGLSATTAGRSRVQVFAVATNGGGRTALGQVRPSVRLRAGHTATVTVPLRVASLSPGSYSLVIEKTDPAGDVIDAAGPALTVAAPRVALSATLGSVAPVAVTPGRSLSFTLTITNVGNVSSTGKSLASVYLSADGSAPTVPVATLAKRLTIPAGKAVAVRWRVKVPRGTAGGTFYPMVTFAEGTATFTAVAATSVTV